MSDFVEIITQKLNEFQDASPVGKITLIVQMRSMFDHASLQDGFDLIDSINDMKKYQILVGVGMKGAFYYRLGKRVSALLGI